MALKIYKKSLLVWQFIDELLGEFIPSAFSIDTLNNKVTIVYKAGANSRTFNLVDIELYDIGEISPYPTFLNTTAFMLKLEDMACPCFPEFISNSLLSKNLTNYENATLPILDDDKIIIFQSGVPKIVNKSEIATVYKKTDNFLFSVNTNGIALSLPADQKNLHQSVFSTNHSPYGALGLTLGSGIPETAGVINLSYFSDVVVPHITASYISKVSKIVFSYARAVSEVSIPTNIMIRVMADTKYNTDMQLVAEYNLISSTFTAFHENKVSIPILTHLNLSAYSNIKWCVRVNNGVAQSFRFIRLNVITEEV